MTMVLPSTASSYGTCPIDRRSSVDAPVLLQQSFTPTAPLTTAVAKPASRAGLALGQQPLGQDLQSQPLGLPASVVEAGSDAYHERNSALRQEPPSELTFAKKCGFCFLSLLFLVGAALYMKKIIDDYEEAATISTPPWYVDTKMLIKITCTTLLSWLFLGVYAFTQVLLFNDSSHPSDPPRHLTAIESLYLSSQIITTVGYGDFTPAKPIGQIFLALYVLFGVTLVAIVVAEVLDHAMTAYSDSSSETLASETFFECDEHHPGEAGAAFAPAMLSHAASTAEQPSDEIQPKKADDSLHHSFSSRGLSTTKHHGKYPQDTMLRCVFVFLNAATIGTLFFYFYPGEDKTIWQAFYMSCVTLTTVGFGAIHPQTQGGYLFATFWMLIGVSCTANMICTIGDSLLKHRRDLTCALMKEECLKEMDADGSGKVDKIEFLRFELVRRGVCKKHDIDNALAIFDSLDTDHSGELDFEDLKDFVS